MPQLLRADLGAGVRMSGSVGVMSRLSETFTRQVGQRMSIETTVYEDGYIHAILMDEFGMEMASMDGMERNANTRGLIEDLLHDQYNNN